MVFSGPPSPADCLAADQELISSRRRPLRMSILAYPITKAFCDIKLPSVLVISTMFFPTPHLLYRSFPIISKEALKKVQSSDIARVCLFWQIELCQDRHANTNKLDEGRIIERF